MAAASAVPVPASHLDVARDAEPATRAANAAMAAKLPFGEVADFEAARRGLIAPVPDGMVRAANGTVLWNLGEYAFIDGELAPATVNPSLWRMARLNLANGLFKVTDRLYQLRGFDISNMTVIEGDTRPDPDRSAHHRRGRARGPGALFRPSPEEAGGGGDLHPQPHRPLWRRARRGRRGRRQGGQGPDHRARWIHGGGDRRERAGRHAHGAPRAVPVRLDAAARPARPGRCRAGQGHRARHARPDRAQPEHRAAGRGAHDRRRQDRLPARARDRGAGRDAHVLSRSSACSTWRRTPVRCCTTSSRCAAPWRAIRASGPSISAMPSRSTGRTPRS